MISADSIVAALGSNVTAGFISGTPRGSAIGDIRLTGAGASFVDNSWLPEIDASSFPRPEISLSIL